MSRIFTAFDWKRGADAAMEQCNHRALTTLGEHHPQLDHCGGWDVAAWPCPPAASVLYTLLGGWDEV